MSDATSHKPRRLLHRQGFPPLQKVPTQTHPVLWSALWLLIGILLLQGISLFWTAQRYSGLFAGLLCSPLTLVLNLLPPVLLTLLLYVLTGRAACSLAAPGFLLLTLSLVNVFKINLRGDALVFSDLTLAGEAAAMLQQYAIVPEISHILGLLSAAVCLVVLWLLTRKCRLHGHWMLRSGIAAGCALLLALLMLFVYPSDSLYKTVYGDNGNVSSRNAALWYSAHGVTYGFLHSVLDEDATSSLFSSDDTSLQVTDVTTTEEEPEDPDSVIDAEEKAELQAALEQTIQEEILPDTASVNIIAIQLEAYCDVTDYLDVDGLEEVYATFHALQADGISGRLLVNTNGGGTNDSERSFITGYTSLPDFDTLTNSYVWYLRSLGYTTEGSHPNTGTYYNRVTINANLGFENYFFTEGYYQYLLNTSYVYTKSDAVLFDEIVNLMEACDGPYFSLNVTLQNHGSYSSKACYGTQYLTSADCSDTTVRTIVNNYLNLVATTDQALADMAERLQAMDTPVVLVLFGDHMPYWGNYTSLDYYSALGINADTSTDEGYYNYYSTPYVIWANSAAREVLGTDCTGDGGDIGSCFLMNKVFALCGWQGDEMMQASNALLSAGITMVSSAIELYCENGQLVQTLSDSGQTALEEFLAFQSVWQSDFQYSFLTEEEVQDE